MLGYPTPHRSQRPAMASPYAVYTPARSVMASMDNRSRSGNTGFSSMSNSALVDALLMTPSSEQEQERLAFSALPRSRKASLSALPTYRPAQLADSIFNNLVVKGSDNEHNEIEDELQTSSRSRKRKIVDSVGSDNDYVEDLWESDVEKIPRRRSRRSTRQKRVTAPAEGANLSEQDVLSSPEKKTYAKRRTVPKKEKKARPVRLIRKKPNGMPVPKSLSEAGPADKMMWQWKNQGKNWDEIRAEWKKITGVEPGGSSLSVRYIKLNENLARNGAASDIDLLRFKKEAEEELMGQLWVKVAEKMVQFSPESEHNPKDLQKRYKMLVRHDYNVELLAADDKIRREADDRNNETTMVQSGYEDSLVDGRMPDPGSYNNSVANETVAHLREHEVESLDIHGSSQAIEPLSEDVNNIFTAANGLHQVNGLNDHHNLHNILSHAHGGSEEIDYLILAAGLPSSSAPLNPTYLHGHPDAPGVSVANALVQYGSESE